MLELALVAKSAVQSLHEEAAQTALAVVGIPFVPFLHPAFSIRVPKVVGELAFVVAFGIIVPFVPGASDVAGGVVYLCTLLLPDTYSSWIFFLRAPSTVCIIVRGCSNYILIPSMRKSTCGLIGHCVRICRVNTDTRWMVVERDAVRAS